MIVVKVELWRHSKGERAEAESEELGRMYISNVGGTAKRGDYEVKVMRRGSNEKVQREGFVDDYPRESYPIWELVRRALKAAFG